jgi:hypothetical protein
MEGSEFAALVGVSRVFLRSEPIETRPDLLMGDRPMFHWKCTLAIQHDKGDRYSERDEYVCHFSQGLGHGKPPKGTLARDRRRNPDGTYTVWSNYRGPQIVPPSRGDPPGLLDVLDALFSDAASVEGEDFAGWAREMGYESFDQYEEARRVWDACHTTAKRLRRLFGGEMFDKLLYADRNDPSVYSREG